VRVCRPPGSSGGDASHEGSLSAIRCKEWHKGTEFCCSTTARGCSRSLCCPWGCFAAARGLCPGDLLRHACWERGHHRPTGETSHLISCFTLDIPILQDDWWVYKKLIYWLVCCWELPFVDSCKGVLGFLHEMNQIGLPTMFILKQTSWINEYLTLGCFLLGCISWLQFEVRKLTLWLPS
jgi:hypothetical protein